MNKFLGNVDFALAEIKENLVQTYENLLSYLTNLHDHFKPQWIKNVKFEDLAREMDIWRKPYTRRYSVESVCMMYIITTHLCNMLTSIITSKPIFYELNIKSLKSFI